MKDYSLVLRQLKKYFNVKDNLIYSSLNIGRTKYFNHKSGHVAPTLDFMIQVFKIVYQYHRNSGHNDEDFVKKVKLLGIEEVLTFIYFDENQNKVSEPVTPYGSSQEPPASYWRGKADAYKEDLAEERRLFREIIDKFLQKIDKL